MRFRSRLSWVQPVGALLWMGISFSRFYKHPHEFIGHADLFLWVLQLLIAAFTIASYFFVWWSIDDGGLTERRLWITRTVPWNEIRRIGPWKPNDKPLPKWLAVEYARPAPMSDRGELLIQPTDRNTLAQALRAHAPQADYEVLPLEI